MNTVRVRVVRWRDGEAPSEATDELTPEEPLEIQAGGLTVAVTMRTPGNDAELVAGFLLSEGFVHATGPPLIREEGRNRVNVALDSIEQGALDELRRNVTTSSSCGLCGKTSVESIHRHFPPLEDNLSVSAKGLHSLLEHLNESQPGFARTGGIHAAGLYHCNSGDAVAVREDIGRHNAVDKAIGHAYLKGMLPLSEHALIVSSRMSFEIVQKALAARIPIVAAVSAPSSLAVELGEQSGITVVGFLRPGRMNVYSHPERICAD